MTQFPITKAADLDALDESELTEGYRDGRNGDPEPALNGNRSISYIHGWWNGAADGKHKPVQDWQYELARDYLEQMRK